MTPRQSHLNTLITLLLLFDFTFALTGQTQTSIKAFEVTIVSQGLVVQPLATITLTANDLTISKKVRHAKEKDSVVFAIKLRPTDTLKMISEININKFKNYYANNCIDDGTTINVILKKSRSTKSVILDNYYHDDIGTIIYFVNSIVPAKYKIWYDKTQLISDYNNCKDKH